MDYQKRSKSVHMFPPIRPSLPPAQIDISRVRKQSV